MKIFDELLDRLDQQGDGGETDEERQGRCNCPLEKGAWGINGWHYYQKGNGHPTAFQRCLPYWKSLRVPTKDQRIRRYGFNPSDPRKLSVFYEGERGQRSDGVEDV